MPVTVLMSGPIRPSESAVLEVIASVRRQFPECRIFLCTWTDSPLVREAVDVYKVVPEPSHSHIASIVTARTIQHRQVGFPDESPGGKYSTYKMFYGVECVCQMARPYLADTDPVVRIRTDSILEFKPDYLQSLLATCHSTYIAKRGDGFDWFALTTFGTLLKAWVFSNIHEYNLNLNQSWNPENAVERRVPVPVQYLDLTNVDAYILRENGRKHYYP